MERHDSAKQARRWLERAIKDAKTPEQYAQIGTGYAYLAIAEELHRQSEIRVRQYKGDFSIIQRP
ncbi:hypothetical protein [Glycomyces salinus]|uniref:hypothetical protein n=1 Tax=Glycomyces salinus TaxID=980294 RepID=UPI0018EB17B5|nr:hypothetical protein [Glycomyces salinus]